MNLFLAESSVGRHVPALEELGNAKLISFTFRASHISLFTEITDVCAQTYIRVVNKRVFKMSGEENAGAMLENIYNDEVVDLLKDYHERGGKGMIYLGFDNDANGQLMASHVHEQLILKGVEEKYLVNVPLIETGYDFLDFDLAITYPIEQLQAIMETDRLEQVMMNTGSPTRLGYRNMASLEHLNNRSKEMNPTVERLSLGTSQATYMTKLALDERDE